MQPTLTHVRSLEKLMNNPEYARLDARKKNIYNDIAELENEDITIDTSPTKMRMVEGRKRALQSELSGVADRMMEIANEHI